MVEEDLLYP